MSERRETERELQVRFIRQLSDEQRKRALAVETALAAKEWGVGLEVTPITALFYAMHETGVLYMGGGITDYVISGLHSIEEIVEDCADLLAAADSLHDGKL